MRWKWTSDEGPETLKPQAPNPKPWALSPETRNPESKTRNLEAIYHHPDTAAKEQEFLRPHTHVAIANSRKKERSRGLGFGVQCEGFFWGIYGF